MVWRLFARRAASYPSEWSRGRPSSRTSERPTGQAGRPEVIRKTTEHTHADAWSEAVNASQRARALIKSPNDPARIKSTLELLGAATDF